jgi:hypothetical protein
LAMRRVAAPFKLPKQRGLIPLLATPWCTFLKGGGAKKSDHFFINISQKKNSVLSLNRAFCTLFEAPNKGEGDRKAVKNRSIWGKGLTKNVEKPWNYQKSCFFMLTRCL